MIINAVYLANWKDLSHRRQQQIHRNNKHENKSRIPHEYSIVDSVYIRKSRLWCMTLSIVCHAAEAIDQNHVVKAAINHEKALEVGHPLAHFMHFFPQQLLINRQLILEISLTFS
jgi:hypothetical protein